MKALYDSVETREGYIDRFGNVANSVRVKLTAAEVKLLKTTPQTLIPAPGANKYIQVDKVIGYLDYKTAVFTGGNNLEFRETGATGTKVSADLSSTFLNTAADIVAEVSGIEAQTTRLLDQPIVVAVPTADPGGATAASTLTLIIIYRVIKVYN